MAAGGGESGADLGLPLRAAVAGPSAQRLPGGAFPGRRMGGEAGTPSDPPLVFLACVIASRRAPEMASGAWIRASFRGWAGVGLGCREGPMGCPSQEALKGRAETGAGETISEAPRGAS